MYTCFMHSGRFWEGIELRTMLIKPLYSMDDTRLRCVSFTYLWEVTIILSISHRGVWKKFHGFKFICEVILYLHAINCSPS